MNQYQQGNYDTSAPFRDAFTRAYFTGLRHDGRSNYLFADGHVKAMSLRQTITPEVLWDRVRDWCPSCITTPDCAPPDWIPSSIQSDLKEMDRDGFP